MKPIYSRPVQHRALAFLMLLLLALMVLGGMIWRNLHHFNTVLSHVNYSHSVQNVSVELQQSLIQFLSEAIPESYPEKLPNTVAAINKTLTEMDALIAEDSMLSAETRKTMVAVKTLLLNIDALDRKQKNARLLDALTVLSQALDDEVIERDHSLEKISNDTQAELYLASLTLMGILIVAVLFLHRRILHPLNNLKELLQRLTEENYTPITTDHLDPLLLPVFNSYNDMVKHLAELEEANRLHAQSLQKEVRLATQALLEQQYSLARAERLAAIGEVAAELAHEIRNPLAGIQMAFNNLRREMSDAHQEERMDLIGSELKRMGRLLTDMLDQSRHAPEDASKFDLTRLVNDLLTLTRYQIAEPIQLYLEAPASLWVCLPESGLRQALLNLLLNAADAFEGGAGVVRIKVQAGQDGLLIDVIDSGPGFSQDMLDHGIRPFRSGRQRGNGLGLAMVQRFVKNCGGVIKLSNHMPQGACVSISLPKDCVTGNK